MDIKTEIKSKNIFQQEIFRKEKKLTDTFHTETEPVFEIKT
jgi:hypothetical protein